MFSCTPTLTEVLPHDSTNTTFANATPTLQIQYYLCKYNTIFANIILSLQIYLFAKCKYLFANIILPWTRAGLPYLANWDSFWRFAPWLLHKTKRKKDGGRESSQWHWKYSFKVKMIMTPLVKLINITISLLLLGGFW